MEATISLTEGKNITIQTTYYRWIILFLFANYSASNSYQWIQYSITPDEIMNFFQINGTQLDMLSVIYMIVYIPLRTPP